MPVVVLPTSDVPPSGSIENEDSGGGHVKIQRCQVIRTKKMEISRHGYIIRKAGDTACFTAKVQS